MTERTVSVLRGEEAHLIVTFLNAAKLPVDPSGLSISLYPPGRSPRQGGLPSDAWVYNATLSSGGSGHHANPLNTVTKISAGRYVYSFIIPPDSDLGTAFDHWKGTLDGQALDEVFSYGVVGGGSVGISQLRENNRVTILFNGVMGLDGSVLQESDRSKFFTTKYNPLYASVEQLRLYLGMIGNDLMDDTIYMAIFESSRFIESNFFTGFIQNGAYFNEAKKGFVICKAQSILMQALISDGSFVGGFKKELGDLSVSRFGNKDFISNKLNDLEECMEGWLKVIQSGGGLSPYTNLSGGYTVRGVISEDAITVEREWGPVVGNQKPMANSSSYRHDMTSSRKKYRTYSRKGSKW